MAHEKCEQGIIGHFTEGNMKSPLNILKKLHLLSNGVCTLSWGSATQSQTGNNLINNLAAPGVERMWSNGNSCTLPVGMDKLPALEMIGVTWK